MVVLQHKPRGLKGAWCNVEQGQRIRVTKGKGKRLKLEIRIAEESLAASISLRLDKLQIRLFDVDKKTYFENNDGFTVEVLFKLE